ncbi:MAG: Asp-tRNA(Asn)/Glu-tRNA(Gln) amidotransferase subunit GatB [Bacteroidetes bacterium]|nr:Asp-tRNA(Asn)/Glu-tRNA(Gln) amidotransferase subunit GatB [Bacteroidota bacterium]HET6244867.1 Asp-tRNA(Asn)/Glu-tRNA(Gln) amidotransferase subunit GatB [Bacteroidia bacterium]
MSTIDPVFDKYEPVIGLEIHIQLATRSKAYSSDPSEYGNLPNTNVSVISLGHPGTLPKTNKKVIEYAIRLGLACNSNIREVNQYARKNYFYADLPKGYQITQDKTPICTGGFVTIKVNGEEKRVALTRIHMEEDAGKSIHDQDPYDSLIDLNRAGVPLLEIVTEPDIRTSEEAYQFVSEIRKLVRYLEICDGNMEEGSLRCDANISVMLKGSEKFGTKVEVKNMNSMRHVQKAIEHEIKRQILLVEKSEAIMQDTRSFDAVTGTTFSLRSKEAANDYRYFPEPDLQPVIIKQEYIDKIKASLPPLPDALYKKYVDQLGLSSYDAAVLTESKPFALYFEELIKETRNYKAATNWIMGDIKSYLNQHAMGIEQFPVKPSQIAMLIKLIDESKISHTIASQKVFPLMVQNPLLEPITIAQQNNWIQEQNSDSMMLYVSQAIEKYPEKVLDYKNGKTGLMGLFMGEVMKLSNGKADPKIATELLKRKLEEDQ